MPTLDLQPTLVGATIRLAPLRAEDFDALYAVAADPLIWEQHPDPLRHQRPVFEAFFADALASASAFCIFDEASGHIIGSSRYYEWNPADREIAIGYTFLARRHWGGATNAEAKWLMIRHALRGARIVWFHVGPDNWRSRSAMKKIGGIFSHQAPKELNGRLRDYVFFKIEAPPEP